MEGAKLRSILAGPRMRVAWSALAPEDSCHDACRWRLQYIVRGAGSAAVVLLGSLGAPHPSALFLAAESPANPSTGGGGPGQSQPRSWATWAASTRVLVPVLPMAADR